MKKLLIIFSVLALLIAAGLVYYFNFTPLAQAQTVASNIISAANRSSPDEVKRYGAPDNISAFVEAVSQRNYRLLGHVQDGETYYFAYAFTDSNSPKAARIGIKGNKIESLATGDKLGKLPKDDSKDVVKVDNGRAYCLDKNDLKYLDTSDLYARVFRGGTMLFGTGAEELSYSGTENGTKLLNRIGDFYKISKDKDYQISIRGYAPDPVAYRDIYNKQIAITQNRAIKIQNDLIKRGIDRGRITIDAPFVYNEAPPNPQDIYIDMLIVNLCNK